MIETPFEIGHYSRPLYERSQSQPTSYQALLQNFCAGSYGLYTQYFIKKIAADAQSAYPSLVRFCIRKSMRKCVKKFLLTDLELVFLAYYCNVNSWDYGFAEFGKQTIQKRMAQDEAEEIRVEMFIDFNAYFIKSYVGNSEQFTAIQAYISQSDPKFGQNYKKWVLSKSQQIFNIHPRAINQLYRQYSRNSHTQSSKKNYNDLVDTIIDLSTTYSIIPNKKVDKEKNSQKNGKNNKSKQSSVNQNVSHQNENRKKLKRQSSQIHRILEEQLIQQSDVPKSRYQIRNKENKRKSSIFFQSMQSFSRKSEQLPAEINFNEEKEHQEPRQQSPLERSREKKNPNKISLSFKRKEKPNETVLGFLKQPSIIQPEASEERDKSRGDNRSVLNNMSFINLRSNRSSRSNSQLPFFWKPSEGDNFFDRSKFG